MSQPINVVFLWHFHQPCYLNYATGFYEMPWVRLHGIKDYYGFALLLNRFPEVKATFNLTPILVEQILDTVNRKAEDNFLKLSYQPADTLTAEERSFILRNFFALNWETMMAPFPRYQQILQKRGRTISNEEISEMVSGFTVPEIRDLQVLFNLAWFHPILRSEDKFLRDLAHKGRNYTEEEKTALLDYQYEILAKIVPLWKKMAEENQIEISISPYYHPILPLLLNAPAPLPQDAVLQIKMAQQSCRDNFGKEPSGCWPPEGAVSNEVMALLIGEKFRWSASDEGILRRSWIGENFVQRNIYQTYRYQGADGEINLIFRDQRISDKIGFAYRFREPKSAADDLFSDISRIRSLLDGQKGVVNIIMDGENAWEYYPDEGIPFLTNLYSRFGQQKEFRTATVSEMLSEIPPSNTLSHIHAGSWINQDFHIWSGYPAANSAWGLLNRARQGEKIEDIKNPEAKKSILAAEGSDWFWWYSPEHSSGRDEEFDALFRLFLSNFYRLQGEVEPENLHQSITSIQEEVCFPNNPITPEIDGKETTYFEWLGAGHFLRGVLAGTMHPSARIIRTLYFGWDENNLYLRLDPDPSFADEDGFTFCLDFGSGRRWSFKAENGTIIPGSYPFAISQDKIIEISFPWKELGLPPGTEIPFAVEVRRNEHLLDRYPQRAGLKLIVPGEDYKEIFWK